MAAAWQSAFKTAIVICAYAAIQQKTATARTFFDELWYRPIRRARTGRELPIAVNPLGIIHLAGGNRDENGCRKKTEGCIDYYVCRGE